MPQCFQSRPNEYLLFAQKWQNDVELKLVVLGNAIWRNTPKWLEKNTNMVQSVLDVLHVFLWLDACPLQSSSIDFKWMLRLMQNRSSLQYYRLKGKCNFKHTLLLKLTETSELAKTANLQCRILHCFWSFRAKNVTQNSMQHHSTPYNIALWCVLMYRLNVGPWSCSINCRCHTDIMSKQSPYLHNGILSHCPNSAPVCVVWVVWLQPKYVKLHFVYLYQCICKLCGAFMNFTGKQRCSRGCASCGEGSNWTHTQTYIMRLKCNFEAFKFTDDSFKRLNILKI